MPNKAIPGLVEKSWCYASDDPYVCACFPEEERVMSIGPAREIVCDSGHRNRIGSNRRYRSRLMARVRLDALLTERGEFPSRSAAARAIRAGEVRLGPDGPIALRPGQMIESDQRPQVIEKRRWVSRGGDKLETALEAFGIDPRGLDCIDVGASTGGFTHCLLENGARHVVAVDVAYGQLADELRRDHRVTELSRQNARELRPEDLPFRPQLATFDLSFISLTKVLPAVADCLAPDCHALAMVKPQFELTRAQVRGGVVRDPALRREAVSKVAGSLLDLGFDVRGFRFSGLPGPKGNRETFVWATRGRVEPDPPEALDTPEKIEAELAETEL